MRFPDVSQLVFVKKLLITLLNSSVAIECWQVGVRNETDLILSPPTFLYSPPTSAAHLVVVSASVLSDSLTCALAALPLFWMELHNTQASLSH